MKDRLEKMIGAILNEEQRKCGIDYGDCPPDVQVILDTRIEQMAEILDYLIALQRRVRFQS